MRTRPKSARIATPAALATAVALLACSGVALAEPATGETARAQTAFTLDAHGSPVSAKLDPGMQGFSVESADFGHGYLTKELLAERLKALGPHGVLRLGGYSMDLVW